MRVSHLEANTALYCNAVSQPVASQDAYNADTEPPTAEDEYINSVADPQLQLQLRWQKYLRDLKNEAWGDHIALQGIADMLGVTIHVICSHQPTVTVTPRSCDAVCEVFVGLILQCHYVGLDRIPVNDSSSVEKKTVVESVDANNTTAIADDLDDATIEQGDEHRWQISGAPQASMMCVENPESFREIISVAPAEGERPLNFMTDPNFESMSNPDKFPYGTGTYSSSRPRKLSFQSKAARY